jgi:hypothetical protein
LRIGINDHGRELQTLGIDENIENLLVAMAGRGGWTHDQSELKRLMNRAFAERMVVRDSRAPSS